jgi:hypothetical protein
MRPSPSNGHDLLWDFSLREFQDIHSRFHTEEFLPELTDPCRVSSSYRRSSFTSELQLYMQTGPMLLSAKVRGSHQFIHVALSLIMTHGIQLALTRVPSLFMTCQHSDVMPPCQVILREVFLFSAKSSAISKHS